MSTALWPRGRASDTVLAPLAAVESNDSTPGPAVLLGLLTLITRVSLTSLTSFRTLAIDSLSSLEPLVWSRLPTSRASVSGATVAGACIARFSTSSTRFTYALVLTYAVFRRHLGIKLDPPQKEGVKCADNPVHNG